ncbi:MAG: CPBP family intramembrane metalloprotease [Erysipelotrichaceae bacterium]|nr:CPBP family intramembrane metalloprotease [Erysipelotrichaceae bacterium]
MEKRKETGRLLTFIGMIAMIGFVATKAIPTINIEGYSILAGVAFFFIVEIVEKTPEADSGLRFTTVLSDLKKPGVILWVLLPAVSAIVSILLGKLLFDDQFVSHVLGRTDSLLSFDKILLLIGELIIGALGEEIAFRGFFIGKGEKLLPFWACAVLSSLIFSAAHYATGNTAVVLYDLAGIFIDALIYAMIYKKTGNCLISTIGHFLCNVTGLVVAFAFFL